MFVELEGERLQFFCEELPIPQTTRDSRKREGKLSDVSTLQVGETRNTLKKTAWCNVVKEMPFINSLVMKTGLLIQSFRTFPYSNVSTATTAPAAS